MENGILSGTFDLYRKGFKPIALAVVCYFLFSTVYSLLMNLCVYGQFMVNSFDYRFSSSVTGGEVLFMILLMLLFMMVAFTFISFMKLLVRNVDTDEPIVYPELLNASIKKIPKLLLLSLLLGLGYIALSLTLGIITIILGLIIMIPTAFIFSKSALAAAGPVEMIFLMVLMGLGFIPFLVRISLCFTVAVLEDIGPMESLKKSWNLVRGAGWPIFGYELAIYLIIFAVILLDMGITTLLTRSLGADNIATITVTLLLNFLAAIVGPLFTILLYRIYQWRNVTPLQDSDQERLSTDQDHSEAEYL